MWQSVFEPTGAHAGWALMHCFLSVCPSVIRPNLKETNHILRAVRLRVTKESVLYKYWTLPTVFCINEFYPSIINMSLMASSGPLLYTLIAIWSFLHWRVDSGCPDCPHLNMKSIATRTLSLHMEPERDPCEALYIMFVGAQTFMCVEDGAGLGQVLPEFYMDILESGLPVCAMKWCASRNHNVVRFHTLFPDLYSQMSAFCLVIKLIKGIMWEISSNPFTEDSTLSCDVKTYFKIQEDLIDYWYTSNLEILKLHHNHFKS